MTQAQEKYLEEFNKYKHIVLKLDLVYVSKKDNRAKYKIVLIDEEQNKAIIQRIDESGNQNPQEKTLHWCRKNFITE